MCVGVRERTKTTYTELKEKQCIKLIKGETETP